jgi:hypothetical protein
VTETRDLMERLDRAVPPHTRSITEGGDADSLVDAARRLAQGPDIRLTEASMSQIEARLRQRAASHPARPAPAHRPIVRYALAACLIIILAFTGMTSVSAESLPGDELYSFKRAVEDVRLALASDNGKTDLHVDFAERRLDEFQTMLTQRHTFYPLALEEAADEINEALDRLAAGHGRRADLDPRLLALAQRQARLVERAAPLASSRRQRERLEAISEENRAIQQRIAAESTIPVPTPDLTPTPTTTPTPIPTPTMTPTPRRTPVPADESSRRPTRTPPGHGATPGLGSNPPGQGGDNPGIGNNGSPPGQDKNDKDKKK